MLLFILIMEIHPIFGGVVKLYPDYAQKESIYNLFE